MGKKKLTKERGGMADYRGYLVRFYDDEKGREKIGEWNGELALTLDEVLAVIITRVRWYKWAEVARMEDGKEVEIWKIDLDKAAEVMDILERECERDE